jgi:hypothetical protein
MKGMLSMKCKLKVISLVIAGVLLSSTCAIANDEIEEMGSITAKTCIPKRVAMDTASKFMECAAIFHFGSIASFVTSDIDRGEHLSKMERLMVTLVTDIGFFSHGDDYIGGYSLYLSRETLRKSSSNWRDVDSCQESVRTKMKWLKAYLNEHCFP